MLVRIKSQKGFYLGHGEDNSMHQVSFKDAGVWEDSKAKRVLKNLPSYLTRFGPYEFEPADDCVVFGGIEHAETVEENHDNCAVIEGVSNLSEEVVLELEHLVSAFNTLDEVPDKLRELDEELRYLDNKRLDLLHVIELEASKNMYQGYLLYKELREVSLRRRKVKDLIMIYVAWRDAFRLNNSSDVVVSSVKDALTDRRYYFRTTDNN